EVATGVAPVPRSTFRNPASLLPFMLDMVTPVDVPTPSTDDVAPIPPAFANEIAIGTTFALATAIVTETLWAPAAGFCKYHSCILVFVLPLSISSDIGVPLYDAAVEVLLGAMAVTPTRRTLLAVEVTVSGNTSVLVVVLEL